MRRPSLPAAVALAAGLDGAAVLAFVAVGRASHAEPLALGPSARTAWPFLAGLAAGWLAARAWRSPVPLRTGVVVWGATVAVGLVLRVVGGEGAPLSFTIVTAVVLAVGLLGWRALAVVARRRRRRAETRATADAPLTHR